MATIEVSAEERFKNAEYTTNPSLRKDMLDKIPSSFFQSINTVFEPCVGKGGFVLDIIERFMKGLEPSISNKKKRYKTIVEKCLYFADINENNVAICKELIDPTNIYKLNYHIGDTLVLDIKSEWGVDGFDLVVGNPPFNLPFVRAIGHTLWQFFTKKALNEFIKPKGYLLFVHPCGWRKPNTPRSPMCGMFELMVHTNQLIYLSIHSTKDGKESFNCNVRHDWYLIQKIKQHTTTHINDIHGNDCTIDLSDLSMLPNSDYETFKKIVATDTEEKCPLLYSAVFTTPKLSKFLNDFKTDEFKYQVIHTLPLKGIRSFYSNRNDNGMFGIPKVIFGDNGLNDAVIDMEGVIGTTSHSMAIEVGSLEEAENIKKCLLSNKFKLFINNSCLFGNFRFEYTLYKLFKRDFWKEFILYPSNIIF